MPGKLTPRHVTRAHGQKCPRKLVSHKVRADEVMLKIIRMVGVLMKAYAGGININYIINGRRTITKTPKACE